MTDFVSQKDVANTKINGAEAGRRGAEVASSRIAGFAKMNAKARLQALVERGILDPSEVQLFQSSGLPGELAESFIENCVGGFALPLGLATNFLIDGEEIFIPMAVEESSVVAAASHGAKLARSGGGFTSEKTETIATCQIQFISEGDFDVIKRFDAIKGTLGELANACHPRLVARGGGVRSVELRYLNKPGYYVIHLNVDTREAMGANIVNTMAETVGRKLPEMLPCAVGLKILTNLTVHRVTRVRCEVDFSALEVAGFEGEDAARRICRGWEFADLDPFRAATHNKGVMNGIDPVVIATGNDWRAVEAGCHAFAALSGSYKPLTTWKIDEGARRLVGEIAVPIAVGTIGGVTRLHPTVHAALKVLGHPSSERLSAIIASVGLAQNLSAIRALSCEGIQLGHMALHEKNIEMMRRYDHVPPLSPLNSSSRAP